MEIEIRDARIEDVPVVAWTVLTALDMSTDDMDRFVKSCSDEDTMYSWKNSYFARKRPYFVYLSSIWTFMLFKYHFSYAFFF